MKTFQSQKWNSFVSDRYYGSRLLVFYTVAFRLDVTKGHNCTGRLLGNYKVSCLTSVFMVVCLIENQSSIFAIEVF